MPDNQTLLLELITETANKIAWEIGIMKPDDPTRAVFIKDLSELMQLRRSLRLGIDQPIGLRIDELASEMTILKPGDPRRAQIGTDNAVESMLKEL